MNKGNSEGNSVSPTESWDCGEGVVSGTQVGGRSHSQRVAPEANLSISTLNLLLLLPEDQTGNPEMR